MRMGMVHTHTYVRRCRHVYVCVRGGRHTFKCLHSRIYVCILCKYVYVRRSTCVWAWCIRTRMYVDADMCTYVYEARGTRSGAYTRVYVYVYACMCGSVCRCVCVCG